MQDERQDPRLVVRELDDLAVLLVEPELERRPYLDAEAERRRDGVHPLGTEPPTRPLPRLHDLRDSGLEAAEVVPIDHDRGRRARMGLLLVAAVGERDAEPVARPPAFPPRLALEDPNERVHLVLRLMERVLVKDVRARMAGLRPSLDTRVELDPAALDLEREEPELGVRDDEVRLPLVRSLPAGHHPVD